MKKILLVIAAVVLLVGVGGAGKSNQGRIPWKDPAPIASTTAEQKILDVLADIYLNQRIGMMNVQPEDERVLRLLTEAVGGKLTTHEFDASRASLARENFNRAGVSHLVTLVEGDAHKTVAKLKEPIDILFLGADKAGYIDYLNKLLPLVRPGGLILAHNTTNVRSPMEDYIKAVTTSPKLETKFIHKHDQGIDMTLKKR